MAKCSISDQEVISGYYASYTTVQGDRYFFAMDAAEERGHGGTIAVSIHDVADFIDDIGNEPDERGLLGTLRWNPREIRWRGVLLRFLSPVHIPVVESDNSVLDQLMAGGSTRIRRVVSIDGEELRVDVSQMIPPLLFADVTAEQDRRARAAG